MKKLILIIGICVILTSQVCAETNITNLELLLKSVKIGYGIDFEFQKYTNQSALFNDLLTFIIKEMSTWKSIFENPKPDLAVKDLNSSAWRLLDKLNSTCEETTSVADVTCDKRMRFLIPLWGSIIGNISEIAADYPTVPLSTSVKNETMALAMNGAAHFTRLASNIIQKYAKYGLDKATYDKAAKLSRGIRAKIEIAFKTNNDSASKLKETQKAQWASNLKKFEATVLKIKSPFSSTLKKINLDFYNKQSINIKGLSPKNLQIYTANVNSTYTGLEDAAQSIITAVNKLFENFLTVYYPWFVDMNLLLTETGINATLLFNHVYSECEQSYFNYELCGIVYKQVMTDLKKQIPAINKRLVSVSSEITNRLQKDRDNVIGVFKLVISIYTECSNRCKTDTKEPDSALFKTCLEKCQNLLALNYLKDYLAAMTTEIKDEGLFEESIKIALATPIVEFFKHLDVVFSDYIINTGLYTYEIDNLEDFTLHT